MSCAVFTVCKNEKQMLPIWLRYYSQYFASEDIYVLDHESDDGSISGLNVNVVVIKNDLVFEHFWLIDQVCAFQKKLLETYQVVLFAESDEIVIPNLSKYPKGLVEYIDNLQQPYVTCCGWEVVQRLGDEPELDWNLPILSQRKYGVASKMFSKTLLSTIPLPWDAGFHNILGIDTLPDPNLAMFHLHSVDLNYTIRRTEWKRNSNLANQGGLGFQHRWTTQEVTDNHRDLQPSLRVLPAEFTNPIVL